VEDHAFTQADSPSWGGHLNEFAATTDRFTGDNPGNGGITSAGWGCDSGMLANWVSPRGITRSIPSCIPDYSLGLPNGGAFEPTPAAHVPTIMDEMAAAGVSWKIYSSLKGTKGYVWAGCPSFADCLDTSQAARQVADAQFFTAAAAGRLPAVSFVMPNLNVSQHNDESNAAGDNWIGKVASAVMASPDWSSTALIITYDDCGCFYDQVPPPLAPDGRQMGPRVPFLVISPYAKPGYTDSTVTSNTGSILAFIESTFGLPALNVDDAKAYNLSGMFNFAQAPLAPKRMLWRHLPTRDYRVSPSAAHDVT
jgi:phospholipase C